MRKSFYLYSHERVYSGGGYINKTKLPKGSVLEIVFLFCQAPAASRRERACGAERQASKARPIPPTKDFRCQLPPTPSPKNKNIKERDCTPLFLPFIYRTVMRINSLSLKTTRYGYSI